MKVNEKKFYDALENLFIGANIEGEGGYINLLKIKSTYFKKVLKQFQREVEEDPIITDDFKEEFFDKLYSFFEKYFSESGSVYFVKTANWQIVYEQVYTDNKDVVLFWKTHMLYYVKSDILFQSMNIEVTDDETGISYSFYFDVGTLQNKKNNEKKEIVFTFREVKEENDKKIYIFDVAYSERGTKTKINDIVKKTKIPEEILEKAFRMFKKQSEVDFFINKNAKKFLEEQLDMYLHQILLAEENKFDQKRLDQLKTIQKFAKKIIAFISQFEDELVRVWNKPKFVLNSNYVITLDKLSDEIINKIVNHPNLQEQIKEWIELGIVEEGFDFNKRDNKKHKYLPIDTKYFKDLELDILALFDNLDEALDGRLIHSENYQALNTLLPKYKEKIQTIYIDPPFNTGSDFAYIDKYQDSSWLTLMNDRIKLGKEFLRNNGSFYLHLDYRANHLGKVLMNQIFGEENFINEIIWRFGWVSGYKTKADMFIRNHQTILFYKKEKLTFNKDEAYVEYQTIPYKQYSECFSQFLKNLNLEHSNIDILKTKLTFFGDKVYKFEKNRSEIINQKYPLEDIWNGNEYDENLDSIMIQSFVNEKVVNAKELTQKPESLLKRIISISSSQGSIIFDFFSGSGTTINTAHKLKRKWIGVEMGDYFYTTILPRLKETINGKSRREPCGISKQINWEGGGFFKYYELEQYEDTLRNMRYKDNTPTDLFDTKKAFEQYIFLADEKFAHVLKVNGDNLEIDFDNLYPNIDFAETISNLLGLPIKKITKTSVILQDGDREKEIKTDYKNMTNEEKLEFIRLLRPLLWWGE